MRYLDLAVLLVYLVGITWFGAHFRKSQKSLRDYFLGGRKTPWWAIGFSIVSAETSTLTVIGTLFSDILLAWVDPRIRLTR